MPNNSVNNKRIAKNTLFLYLRSIVVMVVGIFTSRVVLQTLGVEDSSIYNVVGELVAMFSIVVCHFDAITMKYYKKSKLQPKNNLE